MSATFEERLARRDVRGSCRVPHVLRCGCVRLCAYCVRVVRCDAVTIRACRVLARARHTQLSYRALSLRSAVWCRACAGRASAL